MRVEGILTFNCLKGVVETFASLKVHQHRDDGAEMIATVAYIAPTEN